MKVVNKNILFVALSAMAFTSCIKDFQEVNTNPLQATDEQARRDGLASGAYFNALVQRPIPTGTGVNPANDYQVIQNMSTDNWVGYFSPGRNHWDNGTNQTSYYITDHRANGTFNTLIEKVMNPYFKIKVAMHNVEAKDGKLIFTPKDAESKAVYALAQIVKIMGMHRATDLFGPIPYSDMEPGKTKAKYDSQEQVYKAFLKELEQAVATLQEFGTGNKVLADFDAVYQGDTSKWVRLANSLMLRLAMRVRYADEALAKEYVTKATKGELITDDSQAAKLVTNGRFVFHHSLVTMLGYGELKMGATIYSYLKGYNDPRAEKYFTKTSVGGSSDFYAVRSGIDPNTGADVYKDFSVPTVITTTPTYWLRASEVQFLLAEAALAGYITNGTAQDYYTKGVEMSFVENGLSAAQATTYLAGSEKPVGYTDPKNAKYTISSAVSTIGKSWSSASTDEEHLEQIITQKYLANYPNGFESWSEWRRTGYPRMFPVPINLSNKGAADITTDGKDKGVRRFPFPQQEFELNTENVTAAKALLEGADGTATNVWWDKKTK